MTNWHIGIFLLFVLCIISQSVMDWLDREIGGIE